MTFNELSKQDYTFRLFENIKTSLAYLEQEPIKLLRFDNKNNCRFVLVKQGRTKAKAITTRCFTVPKDEAVFLTAWFAREFPELAFEHFKGV